MALQLTETPQTRPIIGFFTLPRELRDQIYDDMLAPRIRKHDTGCALVCEVTDMSPPVEAIALSRQFHYEVLSRQKVGVRLALRDRRTSYPPYIGKRRLPQAVLNIKTLDLKLVTLDCHQNWLKPILDQLQSLESINIKVFFWWDPCTWRNVDAFWDFYQPRPQWTSMAHLKSFDVAVLNLHKSDPDRVIAGWDCDVPLEADATDANFTWDLTQKKWMSSTSVN